MLLQRGERPQKLHLHCLDGFRHLIRWFTCQWSISWIQMMSAGSSRRKLTRLFIFTSKLTLYVHIVNFFTLELYSKFLLQLAGAWKQVLRWGLLLHRFLSRWLQGSTQVAHLTQKPNSSNSHGMMIKGLTACLAQTKKTKIAVRIWTVAASKI